MPVITMTNSPNAMINILIENIVGGLYDYGVKIPFIFHQVRA